MLSGFEYEWADLSRSAVSLLVNVLLQSTLVVLSGFLIGYVVRRRSGVLQSAVLRVTLVAAILCPLASVVMSRAGVSGFAIQLPDAPLWPGGNAGPDDALSPTEVGEAEARIESGNEAKQRPAGKEPGLRPQQSAPSLPETRPLAGNVPATPSVPSQRTPAPQRSSKVAGRAAEENAIGGSKPAGLITVHAEEEAKTVLTACAAVFGVWIVVSLALLARELISHWLLRRMCVTARPATAEVQRACRTTAGLLSVAVPDVRVSDRVTSPCLAGLIRPMILLPVDESHASREVFLHELAHLKRADCFWQAIGKLTCAVLWFQPLLWKLVRRCEESADNACDDFVVAHSQSCESYARELLQLAERRQPAWSIANGSVGMLSVRSSLGRRVVRVLDRSRTVTTRLRIATLLAVLTLGMGTVLVGGLIGAQRKPAESQDSAATSREDSGTERATENKDSDGPSSPKELLRIRGRVVDSDGNGKKGVTVSLSGFSGSWKRIRVQTTSDETGRFELSADTKPFVSIDRALLVAAGEGLAPEWVAVSDIEDRLDVRLVVSEAGPPVRGRLLNLEGQPVPGATVSLRSVQRLGDTGVEKFLKIVTSGSYFRFPDSGLRDWELLGEVKTDQEGRFEFKNLGVGRYARFQVQGKAIQNTEFSLLTHDMKPVQARSHPRAPAYTLHGLSVALTVSPSRPIIGRVIDRETKQPVERVQITVSGSRGRTFTDADGKFRYDGSAKRKSYGVMAVPPQGSPYFIGSRRVADQAALGPLETTIELHRGILVTGRVTVGEDDAPVRCQVSYHPMVPNPLLVAGIGYSEAGGGGASAESATEPDGTFAIPVLPGPGCITIRAYDDDAYRSASVDPWEFFKKEGVRYGGNITRQAVPGMLLMAGGNGGVMPTSQDQYHAILLLNPAEDAEPFKRDVRLTPAAMTFVEISDTDGKPLGGSTVYGARGPYDVRPKSITGSSLKFRTPSGEQKQYLVIWHKEKKLAGQTVAVSSTKKLTLRLQPCGSVTGQIVDGDEVVSEMPIGTLSAPGTDRSGWYPGTIPTDEEGRFRLDHLVPGFEYDLRTYDDPRVQIRFTVKPGQTLDLGRIDLKQVDVTAGAASADADVVEEAEQKTVTIRGRVEQQDGSPLGGAGIFERFGPNGTPRRAAISDAAGRFAYEIPAAQIREEAERQEPKFTPFVSHIAVADGFAHTQVHTKLTELSDELKTITVVEELPIEGRIVSADGQPIAGVEVRPVDRQKVAPGKLDDYLRDVKSTGTPWHGEYPNGLLPATLKPARTGADGRFRLEGTPAGHVVRLKLAGDNVQNGSLFVAGRKPRDSEPGEVRLPARSRFPLYLASFTHVSPPHRTVQGIVRDQETGKPVVGVRVNSLSSSETESITDAEGRFKITGCLKQKEYRVRVHVDGRRFFAKFVRLRDRPGVGPIEITIELARGIAASGRVFDKATGKPLKGVVEYHPLYPNEFAAQQDEIATPCAVANIARDGSYAIQTLPGPGILCAKLYGNKSDDDYLVPVIRPEQIHELMGGVKPRGNDLRFIMTSAGGMSAMPILQQHYRALELINPAEDSAPIERDLSVIAGRQVAGSIVGVDGRPVKELRISGLRPSFLLPLIPHQGSTFVIRGLRPGEKRALLFLDDQRKQAARAVVSADQTEDLVIQLQKCASAAGKIVDDADGNRPLADERVVFMQDGLYDEDRWATQTNEQGEFAIAGLIPGEKYTIRVIRGRKSSAIVQDIVLKPDETRSLGALNISGRN